MLLLQVTLCQSWVRFEREHGSAEDQLQAELKVEPIIDAASAAAAAAANEQATAAAQVPATVFCTCRAHSLCVYVCDCRTSAMLILRFLRHSVISPCLDEAACMAASTLQLILRGDQ